MKLDKDKNTIHNISLSLAIMILAIISFFKTFVFGATPDIVKHEIPQKNIEFIPLLDKSYFRCRIEHAIVDTIQEISIEENKQDSNEIDNSVIVEQDNQQDEQEIVSELSDSSYTENIIESKIEESEITYELGEPVAIEIQPSYSVENSVLIEYNWVQHDEEGNPNNMTDDLVLYAYDLCNEYNIDPALVFGMIMVESRGYTNSYNYSSGAAGLGQFLASTAKIVYEDFLGWGVYNHNTTPYDPYVGVSLIVSYLDYLYGLYNGDTLSVLKQYSGNATLSGAYGYYAKVIGWVGRDIY